MYNPKADKQKTKESEKHKEKRRDMRVGDILKNNKLMTNIITVFLIGVILLIAGNSFFFNKEETRKEVSDNKAVGAVISEAAPGYEEQIEKRLAEIFSEVEGAGRVRVMVTLAQSKELIVAEDGSYDKTVTKEVDAAGGSRETEILKTNGSKLVLKGNSGEMAPLIVKELRPKIEGVIVVADGGGDIKVKEQLIKATQTVLGVEPHKVQVLKFKNTK